MRFSIGNKVVHPSHGPCLIGSVINMTVAGQPASFQQLCLLDGSGNAVLIPSDKFGALHMRRLLAKSEIPKLLDHLETLVSPAKNWKQRTLDNAKLLSSGSAFDLAEIVESLTVLNEAKTLASRDRQTLDTARKFLICEISEVMGESKNIAERQLDRALNSKRTLTKSNTALAQLFPSRRSIKSPLPEVTSQSR